MKRLLRNILTAVLSVMLIGIASAETVSVDISGTEVWDLKGDPDNIIRIVDLASTLGRAPGTQVTVTGVSWDINITTVFSSAWLSDARFDFNDMNFVRPSSTNAAGTETNMGTRDFTDNGQMDIVIDDGVLMIEFYSNWGGGSDLVNHIINSGLLTFEVELPEPLPGEFLGLEENSVAFHSEFLAMAAQPDGKMVTAGWWATAGNDFVVLRYNADGTLDQEFAPAGLGTVVDFNNSSNDQAYAVGIQSDGKIVLAGSSDGNFALARFTSTGVLDTTFGIGGKVITDNEGRMDHGRALVIQPDGKIVLAGYSTDSIEQDEFVVLRYFPNGVLDSAFGTIGITTTPIDNLTNDQAHAVALQPNGSIILAGQSANNFALTRYTSTGLLDTTFSGDGILTTTIPNGIDSLINSIALQDDGKIVVGGHTYMFDSSTVNCQLSAGVNCQYYDYALARYSSSGTLDNTFNSSGLVTTNVNVRGNHDFARSIAIQANGKIVAAGTSEISAHDFPGGVETYTEAFDISLVRYNTDGSLDTDFGTNGKVISSHAPFNDIRFEAIEAIALTERGDIFGTVNYRAPFFGLVHYGGDFIPVPQTVAGDQNGDSKSDILWRNFNTGQNWLYQMDGAAITASAPVATVNLNWEMVGRGDYNGDLKTDILWRNIATGENFIYLMDGTSIMTARRVNIVPNLQWKVVGSGDFNHDNKSDILWRNISTGQVYLYLMDGTTIMSQGGIATVSLIWKIVGNSDHTGDNKADILWHNSVTGEVYLYEMDGTAIVSNRLVNIVPDLNWAIVGSGDHDGDDHADILWRNGATGQNFLYLMNGHIVAAARNINTVADANWKVAATGDYNGDGKADILWRNEISGRNWLYQMSGNLIQTSVQVNVVPGNIWKVINTH